MLYADFPHVCRRPQTELEIKKLEADLRKTNLEILELMRWYRRPAILAPHATIVIGVVTAMVGIANGWFTTKLESLNNKQVEAKRDLDDLNQGKSNLSAQNRELEAQKKRLTIERNNLQKQFSETFQLASQVPSLRAKASQAEALKARIDGIQQMLNNATSAKVVLIHRIVFSGPGKVVQQATVFPADFF